MALPGSPVRRRRRLGQYRTHEERVRDRIREVSSCDEICRLGTPFESLITGHCAAAANATYEELGVPGLQVAFETLGRLAMQELVTNADASAAMTTFGKYVDSEKVNAVLSRE